MMHGTTNIKILFNTSTLFSRSTQWEPFYKTLPPPSKKSANRFYNLTAIQTNIPTIFSS